jgi:UDPglucose 6-dehydrogenase
MEITMIGHGYVGLVTASIFADAGNKVNVIGRTPEKISRLKSGDPLIFEPGLEEILDRNLKNGNLNFTLDYDSIKNSKIVFVGVGTPSQKDGSANLDQVYAVAEKIAQNLGESFTAISCKSTVPVGTNREVEKIVRKNAPKNAKFAVASCPEFLREGTGVTDTLYPDRVIIGSESQDAIDLLLELHKPIGGERVITDLASAELIKYASNSILATKISFSNLIAEMSEVAGANAGTVLEAVGLDNRVSDKFLNVGIGYGGACFPKDVKALAFIGKQMKLDTGILDNVEKVNFNARHRFAQRVVKHAKGKKLAIWGLSFKPNTDDIREAPSIDIMKDLLEAGYKLSVYDPQAMGHIERIFGDKLTYCEDKMKALDGADTLVVLTEWNEFEAADLKAVKKALVNPIVLDGRNVYDPKQMKELGFEYYSVGRKDIK